MSAVCRLISLLIVLCGGPRMAANHLSLPMARLNLCSHVHAHRKTRRAVYIPGLAARIQEGSNTDAGSRTTRHNHRPRECGEVHGRV